jgi:hypothetical protein
MPYHRAPMRSLARVLYFLSIASAVACAQGEPLDDQGFGGASGSLATAGTTGTVTVGPGSGGGQLDHERDNWHHDEPDGWWRISGTSTTTTSVEPVAPRRPPRPAAAGQAPWIGAAAGLWQRRLGGGAGARAPGAPVPLEGARASVGRHQDLPTARRRLQERKSTPRSFGPRETIRSSRTPGHALEPSMSCP